MFIEAVANSDALAANIGQSAKEATMELKIGLNVLAAIMSFGFLAAIVLGMI